MAPASSAQPVSCTKWASLGKLAIEGNLEAVKQIAQFGGEVADSWTLREIAKLEILKRQQQHLEKIAQQLSACQRLFSAMFAVTVGAEVGGDCSGEEKARRIRQRYDLPRYPIIYAYGDTGEDEAMLRLAGRKYFRWQEV